MNLDLENEFQPLLDQYKELETVIECSAKDMLNVNEVFYFAQKVRVCLAIFACVHMMCVRPLLCIWLA